MIPIWKFLLIPLKTWLCHRLCFYGGACQSTKCYYIPPIFFESTCIVQLWVKDLTFMNINPKIFYKIEWSMSWWWRSAIYCVITDFNWIQVICKKNSMFVTITPVKQISSIVYNIQFTFHCLFAIIGLFDTINWFAFLISKMVGLWIFFKSLGPFVINLWDV